MVFAVAPAQETTGGCPFGRGTVIDREGRRVEAAYVCRQRVRLNQVLPYFPLQGAGSFDICAHDRQHIAAPIIGGVFEVDVPTGGLFQYQTVFRYPVFHTTQTMDAQMHHVRDEDDGQWSIAQPMPIGMWPGANPVNDHIA